MYDLHEARQKERDKITEYENTNFESGVSVFDVPQEVAELAYRNTSFNPDGAGRRTRIDYVDSIESIYQELKKYGEMHGTLDILVSEFPRLLEGAKRRILDAINADSRCASTMITGPSNFPADRNRKRMDAAMKRWGEYRDYKSKAYEAIKNKMTPAYLKAVQSGQEGGLQILKDRLATAEELQRHMKEVNKIIRGARGDKHKMLAELKKITIGARFLSDKELDELMNGDFLGQKGYARFSLTNNNAEIKRLKFRVEQETKILENKSKSNDVFKFHFGEVHKNYEAVRVQIIFNEKPDHEMISKLKKKGFRWSPRFKAWQRQLNNNGLFAAKTITGINL